MSFGVNGLSVHLPIGISCRLKCLVNTGKWKTLLLLLFAVELCFLTHSVNYFSKLSLFKVGMHIKKPTKYTSFCGFRNIFPEIHTHQQHMCHSLPDFCLISLQPVPNLCINLEQHTVPQCLGRCIGYPLYFPFVVVVVVVTEPLFDTFFGGELPTCSYLTSSCSNGKQGSVVQRCIS